LSYLILKLLHVASVIVFLGNVAMGLFWASHAHRTRDFRLIASTFDGIIRSDRLFTVPAVFGIVITGLAAAIVAGIPILSTGWIFWPIVLFSISGIVFGTWLVPLQRSIRDAARTADASDMTWNSYAGDYKKWHAWGLAALVAPVAAMAVMVLKPALPGL